MVPVKISHGEAATSCVLKLLIPGSKPVTVGPGQTAELHLRAGEVASIRCVDVGEKPAPKVTDADGASVATAEPAPDAADDEPLLAAVAETVVDAVSDPGAADSALEPSVSVAAGAADLAEPAASMADPFSAGKSE